MPYQGIRLEAPRLLSNGGLDHMSHAGRVQLVVEVHHVGVVFYPEPGQT